jgi:hypothetical protein
VKDDREAFQALRARFPRVLTEIHARERHRPSARGRSAPVRLWLRCHCWRLAGAGTFRSTAGYLLTSGRRLPVLDLPGLC